MLVHLALPGIAISRTCTHTKTNAKSAPAHCHNLRSTRSTLLLSFGLLLFQLNLALIEVCTGLLVHILSAQKVFALCPRNVDDLGPYAVALRHNSAGLNPLPFRCLLPPSGCTGRK